MDGPARRGGDSQEPAWHEARRALLRSAEVCAAAAASLALRGGRGTAAAALIRQAIAVMQEAADAVRYAVYDEGLAEAAQARAAGEALGAAGLVPPQGRHLHPV